MKNPGFRLRLGDLIDASGEEPFSWAAHMGISKGAFSRIWHEGTVPAGETLIRIKLEYRDSPGLIDWLLVGEWPPPDAVLKIGGLKSEAHLAFLNHDFDKADALNAQIESIKQRAKAEHPEWGEIQAAKPAYGELDQDDRYVTIPLLEIKAAAGGGSLIEHERAVEALHFRKDWVRSELNAAPADLRLIYIHGDSMEPTLHAGDVILLNMREHQVARDGIYVLRIDGSLLVKRLQRLPGGGLMVISDNPAYQAFQIKAPEFTEHDISFIGRVVWVGRRI